MKIHPILLCHPNIPKPLHTLNPRTIKGNKWWEGVKKEAKAKFNDHCWTCGIHKDNARFRRWLEGHESYSIDYSTGRVEYIGTCGLCHACHNFIHDGRLINMINKNEYNCQQFEQIMNHGNAIIKAFVESLGYKWIGGKQWAWQKDEDGFSVLAKTTQLLDLYPFMKTFSNKVQWLDGNCDWNQYHLVVDGIRYERKFDSLVEWQSFYA
jgi:hypothetical protein